MEVYRTEEEQVEALKKWWRENGRSVLIGVAIALALVFGWRSWVDHRTAQAEAASVVYQQMVAEFDAGNAEAARIRGQQIIEDYSGTVYAPLASLLLGRLALEEENLSGAAASLRWAMENAAVTEVERVARLRLARVLHEQGESQQALALLDAVKGGAFEAPYSEAKGDIHLAMGERSEAKRAYERALAGYVDVPQKQALLQMKLDDLADVNNVKGTS